MGALKIILALIPDSRTFIFLSVTIWRNFIQDTPTHHTPAWWKQILNNFFYFFNTLDTPTHPVHPTSTKTTDQPTTRIRNFFGARPAAVRRATKARAAPVSTTTSAYCSPAATGVAVAIIILQRSTSAIAPWASPACIANWSYWPPVYWRHPVILLSPWRSAWALWYVSTYWGTKKEVWNQRIAELNRTFKAWIAQESGKT